MPDDYSEEVHCPSIATLTDLVIREVLINFHLKETGGIASLFRLATYLPAREFARIMQQIDRDALTLGLHGATSKVLYHFVTRLEIRGFATPREGPLMVAANHPGGTDPFVMTAAIDRRDLHIVSQDHQLFKALPNIRNYLISMAEDRSNGHLAVRKMMALLRERESVLIYPGGELELDPALFPGSRNLLRGWSRSIALILSRMPDVVLQPVILRGTISQQAWKSWLVKLGRSVTTRLQIAMIVQIAFQQLKHDAYPVQTTLIKGPPLNARELDGSLNPDHIQQSVMAIVNELLGNDPDRYPLLEEIHPVHVM
jgi:1-acyl-sn-glycerol-3-phosphate acyltransferase